MGYLVDGAFGGDEYSCVARLDRLLSGWLEFGRGAIMGDEPGTSILGFDSPVVKSLSPNRDASGAALPKRGMLVMPLLFDG